MAFSGAERKRRDKAMHRVIEAKGLKALILIGDTNVGSEYLGDFRYYVDNRIIAGQQVAILFPQTEPVLFMGTAIQQQAASRRSSVRDCRVSDDRAGRHGRAAQGTEYLGRQGRRQLRDAFRTLA